MRLRDCIQPELLPLATEVFDRSWQFIERDPVLAGEDRRTMQTHLARLIAERAKDGERNPVAIANNAISTLRQQCASRRDRLRAIEEMA